MEEAAARRGQEPPPPVHEAGYYETAFRVLGRYMDEQKPKDVFFFEQGGAFVVRLLMAGQQGSHHELSEFTKEDIESLVTQGPALRVPDQEGGQEVKALKTVAVALGITLGALIVIPLAVLAGLFVWLKVTEEEDEEILELDREGV